VSRLDEIAARRGALLERARAEREHLGAAVAPVVARLALVDRGWAKCRWVRTRPWLVVIAVAALVVARPARAMRWARLGLGAWQAWRWLGAALKTGVRP
jgi:hypothetical protein